MAKEETDDGLRDRWATIALLGVNVCVFLAMLLAGANPMYTGGAALAAGGVEPSLVWQGEVWRFLSACFVHLGIWHIAMNGWVLWQLGPTLERFCGGSRMLLIYLSTGVFGFAMSTSLRAGPSAGASGAIFGITGALLAIALMLRSSSREQAEHGELGRMLLQALVPFVGVTLLLGFLVPGIDNMAHVGGLVFGVIVGYGLSAGDPALFGEASTHARARGAAALVGGALLFLVVTAYGARPVLSPHYHAVAGLGDLRARDLNSARTHAAAAARLGAEDASTFILLGRLRADSAAAGPAGDADRTEAVRLVREGLKRTGRDDVTSSFTTALATLSLTGGTQELPFSDLRTVDALCTAALLAHEDERARMNAATAAGDAADQAAELENACAWLRLKAPDASLRDPVGALALARRAVLNSEGKNASIVHTLAEALAQNGQPEEALAYLEKIAAQGGADELPQGQAFLTSERERIKRMVSAARRPAAGDAGTLLPTGSR